MNINDLVASQAARQIGSGATTSTAAKASAPVAAASQQFAKVDKRLQADVDTTTANLSKFGLLKSAVASGQWSGGCAWTDSVDGDGVFC